MKKIHNWVERVEVRTPPNPFFLNWLKFDNDFTLAHWDLNAKILQIKLKFSSHSHVNYGFWRKAPKINSKASKARKRKQRAFKLKLRSKKIVRRSTREDAAGNRQNPENEERTYRKPNGSRIFFLQTMKQHKIETLEATFGEERKKKKEQEAENLELKEQIKLV